MRALGTWTILSLTALALTTVGSGIASAESISPAALSKPAEFSTRFGMDSHYKGAEHFKAAEHEPGKGGFAYAHREHEPGKGGPGRTPLAESSIPRSDRPVERVPEPGTLALLGLGLSAFLLLRRPALRPVPVSRRTNS